MKKIKNNWDFEENDLNIEGNSHNSYINQYNEDEEDDDISLETEEEIIKNLDEDLIKFFNEAKIIKKKKLINNFKKNKKDKKEFSVGQKVKIGDFIGKILFGPYEIDNKVMCEIELDNGNIIAEDINDIEKI